MTVLVYCLLNLKVYNYSELGEVLSLSFKIMMIDKKMYTKSYITV